MQIEWNSTSSTGKTGQNRLVMQTFPHLRETSFDLYTTIEDGQERWAITNLTVSAAKSVRDALDSFIGRCDT